MIDSRYATLALVTLCNSAISVLAVMLPEVQKGFRISRAEVSLPYTLIMIGFGLGDIL